MSTTKNSRATGKSNVFAHSFLENKDDIKSFPAKEPGIKNYKVHNKTHIMVNDLIIKWSEKGDKKSIFRVLSSEHLGTGDCGRMEDLVFSGKITQDVVNAILLMDPTAAFDMSIEDHESKKKKPSMSDKWGHLQEEEDTSEVVTEGDIEDLSIGHSRYTDDDDSGPNGYGGGHGWEFHRC